MSIYVKRFQLQGYAKRHCIARRRFRNSNYSNGFGFLESSFLV